MGSAVVQPYLFFGGRCEEAIEFYRTSIGAEVDMVMLYRECPEPIPPDRLPPGFEDKVMHASFRVGGSTIMASDGCAAGAAFAGFFLSLTLPTVDDTNRAFAALSTGGQVVMPLAKTFYSPQFGMVTDKFGVGWMVMAEPPACGA